MYKNELKRIVDIAIALLVLIILVPVVLVVYVLLKSNQKEVFFTQDRPGKNGKIFKVIKFKTMNDMVGIDGRPLADHVRLTSIGKFIRSTSLDELPQLINVLRGEMSLIGPRPLLVRYLPLYSAKQNRRHEVRPGITGWAQVNGRNALSWEQKFDYDVWYVDHVTFWLDLKIIALTLKKVIVREGISSTSSVTMEPFKGISSKN
ncbi:sugar transferase [Flavobacterium lacus]|uniref:Lipopolysaccharide/colanic/teichoic acid biosynthesis glycosyltransferase n=1 Tax=Flavobacterium lacus TaxID=1353778 RepID=A0A328WQ44_9FLAO|nr:sugar transferase [Flavobacterium lacus]RAR47226.1 lipopolysaccharide/colanic/teichoic acid biosynthesis glycosyltransferase [Flavobacterium lacus]